ncbi:helix-turn-helix domain-containing protein [Streptomyces monticola]|uniref:Helix-turn-helix domain-containing protein n=1 Tax=Streptomyces monticola TaxID=2666263 RepID=A0ABW2JMT1_9ACTN
MTGEESRRWNLRSLLTQQRARLTPQSVGLCDHRSRPRSGLSQQLAARLIGVTPRYYGQLERGQIRTPDRSLLRAVADQLLIEGADRDLFFLLAAPGCAVPPSCVKDREPTIAEYEFLQRMEPNPTAIMDRAWNVLAYNAAVVEWFADPKALPPGQRNAVLWLFSDEAADRILGVSAERRSAVARLRTAYSNCPTDPLLQKLVAQLEAHPTASVDWRQQAARVSPVVYVRQLRHPRFGICCVPAITAALPGGLQISIHFVPGQRS